MLAHSCFSRKTIFVSLHRKGWQLTFCVSLLVFYSVRIVGLLLNTFIRIRVFTVEHMQLFNALKDTFFAMQETMHVDIALVQLLKLNVLVKNTIILLLASAGMMVGILLLKQNKLFKSFKVLYS